MNDIAQPIQYVDATGTAPGLLDLLLEHKFEGWQIADGKNWFRPKEGNPEFHPEIALVNPSSHLDFQSVEKNPYNV